MFIADFIRDPLWDQARWEATTFGWDKKGAGPPYMGIVFGDAQAAKALFGKWVAKHGNADRWEAIHIAIIEGPLPKPGSSEFRVQSSGLEEVAGTPNSAPPRLNSERETLNSATPSANPERGTLNSEPPPPYFVHISCNPISLASDGEALSTLFLSPKAPGQLPDPSQLRLPSRICQANPLPVPPGQPTLLARFKEEYAKHQQFLLVPVTSRPRNPSTPAPATGRGGSTSETELRVNLPLGIIKRQIIFRRAADLNPTSGGDPLDLDAQALGLVTPPSPAPGMS